MLNFKQFIIETDRDLNIGRRAAQLAQQIEAKINDPNTPKSKIPALRKKLIELRRTNLSYEYKINVKESKERNQAPYTPRNDYEGEMAISQLNNIAKKAETVAKMLKSESKMEAWVQSKITLADDYITTIHDYLQNTPGSVEEEMKPVARKLAGLLAGLGLAGAAAVGINKSAETPKDKLIQAATEKKREMLDRANEINAKRTQQMIDRMRK